MEGWVDLVTRKRRRRESNLRPLGPESNALTTEPPSNILTLRSSWDGFPLCLILLTFIALLTETVPLPAEHCPLICHLDESVAVQPVEPVVHRVPAVPLPRDVTAADRRRSGTTRGVTSRGSGVAMAAVTRRHQQQMTSSRHVTSAVTRKSLQRANRVSEQLSHCPRQRRYNYKLCYSDRQRRAF